MRSVRRTSINLVTLEELASLADERAARARQHAADARDEARLAAARGNSDAERLYLGEALAHEGAARVTEQTAALYRNRIRHLSGGVAPGRPDAG